MISKPPSSEFAILEIELFTNPSEKQRVTLLSVSEMMNFEPLKSGSSISAIKHARMGTGGK